jgi:nitroimidazol reductase NimA-like FMN-containing flavoprotein (pyridoxamine 5'-phosphate oxidase superfamily)
MRHMSGEEREAFLAEPHVGVLSVAAGPDRAPLTTPVWYEYQTGGDIKVVTTPGLRKVRLIQEAGRFALCAQKTDGAYRYVTAEGPVVEVRPASEQERHDLAARYLGAERAVIYMEATREEQSGDIAIIMRPERWNTADFTEMVQLLS